MSAASYILTSEGDDVCDRNHIARKYAVFLETSNASGYGYAERGGLWTDSVTADDEPATVSFDPATETATLVPPHQIAVGAHPIEPVQTEGITTNHLLFPPLGQKEF
jgi:hypothetical protein